MHKTNSTTRKGRPLSKQSFARILGNPLYAGWVVSGDTRVRGNHDPLVSEELFQSVQDRLKGRSSPHKKISEDFPLRGVVRCAKCANLLTAAWAKGRSKRYAYYWCWTPRCKAVKVTRENLERQFTNLLSRMQPTAELLAELPGRAAKQWEERKTRIATEARMLNTRLTDQRTLNQRAIIAKLNGEMAAEDFNILKAAITEKIESIKSAINALDSERNTLADLLVQTQAQVVDLVGAWQAGNLNQRQELALGFFPDGLVFSQERNFFEPANTLIHQMLLRYLNDPSNDGVPDGIRTRVIAVKGRQPNVTLTIYKARVAP